MQRTFRSSKLFLAALIAVATMAIPVGASAVQILPPTHSIYGMTYGDWSAAWWQWLLNLTQANNPYNDATGENCGFDQAYGPVFFLVGGGDAQHEVVRTKCTVPAGKALVVPILNLECSSAEKDTIFYGATERALRDCASKLGDGIVIKSLLVTVDGIKLKGSELKAYRAQSPVYSFSCTPGDNFLTPPPGQTTPPDASSGTSVSDGYWVIVEGLSPGKHTIHVEGELSSPDLAFSQNATYKLTVVKQ